jgi:ribosomal protein L11 methyltransferase
MAYLAYEFRVKPVQPGAEILMAFVSEFAFESFESTDDGFVGYINEEHVTGLYFDFELEDITYSYVVNKIETINWNAEWENNFEPVLVDNLLCIRAPFHEQNFSVKHEIIIMPKMSFGTGHHQTTRLVCKNMFAADFKNKKVLDMGCGTGILAILAKQLGAKDVTGIDIDEWSVENAKENCETNHFSEIKIYKGDVNSLEKEKPFDVIIANINKNILKQQIPTYAKAIASNGILFLSGFFTTDTEDLKSVANDNGFEFVSTENENEWAVMVLRKG